LVKVNPPGGSAQKKERVRGIKEGPQKKKGYLPVEYPIRRRGTDARENSLRRPMITRDLTGRNLERMT